MYHCSSSETYTVTLSCMVSANCEKMKVKLMFHHIYTLHVPTFKQHSVYSHMEFVEVAVNTNYPQVDSWCNPYHWLKIVIIKVSRKQQYIHVPYANIQVLSPTHTPARCSTKHTFGLQLARFGWCPREIPISCLSLACILPLLASCPSPLPPSHLPH